MTSWWRSSGGRPSPRPVGEVAASTTVACSETTGGTASAARLTLLAATLGVTAVVVGAGGLLWPEPAGGGDTYAFADVAPIRDRWWGLLGGLAVVGVVNVTLQALATMLLVRERGSTWATAGAVLHLWPGERVSRGRRTRAGDRRSAR